MGMMDAESEITKQAVHRILEMTSTMVSRYIAARI
jgi:predicted transcriptional regulator